VGSDTSTNSWKFGREADKKTHKSVWVVSKDGLYAVDPAGKVTQEFKVDWLNERKK
jgi:hypothetical protein